MKILERVLKKTIDLIEKQMKIGAYCQAHEEETKKMSLPAIQPFVTSFLTTETISPIGWEAFIGMVRQIGTQDLRKMK